MFIYLNANPSDIHTGDCVIRAIMVLEDQTWTTTMLELTAYSYFMHRIIDNNYVINYSEGVFWTKRQKDDGLGYDTVKHVFFKEEDYNNKRQNDEKLNRSTVQQEDFDRLKEDFYALKHEFQEFIK